MALNYLLARFTPGADYAVRDGSIGLGSVPDMTGLQKLEPTQKFDFEEATRTQKSKRHHGIASGVLRFGFQVCPVEMLLI